MEIKTVGNIFKVALTIIVLLAICLMVLAPTPCKGLLRTLFEYWQISIVLTMVGIFVGFGILIFGKVKAK